MAQRLRQTGVNTEVYLEQAKLRNQLAYADRKGFRVALIAGENEFAQDSVQVKNLTTQEATVHAMDELVQAVRAALNDASPEAMAHGARS